MNYRLFVKDISQSLSLYPGTPSSSSALYTPFAELKLGVPRKLLLGKIVIITTYIPLKIRDKYMVTYLILLTYFFHRYISHGKSGYDTTGSGRGVQRERVCPLSALIALLRYGGSKSVRRALAIWLRSDRIGSVKLIQQIDVGKGFDILQSIGVLFQHFYTSRGAGRGKRPDRGNPVLFCMESESCR